MMIMIVKMTITIIKVIMMAITIAVIDYHDDSERIFDNAVYNKLKKNNFYRYSTVP